MSMYKEAETDAAKREFSSTTHVDSNSEQFFPDRSRDVAGETQPTTHLSNSVPPLSFGIRTQTSANQLNTYQNGSQVNAFDGYLLRSFLIFQSFDKLLLKLLWRRVFDQKLALKLPTHFEKVEEFGRT